MAIRNELTIGVNPKYNGLTMYRKVDDKPFTPEFKFNGDDELDIGSNIEVRYQEYYKDAEGNIIPELVKYKKYVVPNIPATYKSVKVVDQEATYWQEGDELPEGVNVGDIKTQEVAHYESVVDTPAWMAANGWFESLSRTPIVAQVGIMDSIESTLQAFPMDIPDGYHLQGPL